MIPIETLAAFFAASLLLALAPGPDNIFVLTQSAMHGKKAGLAVTLGLCTGLIVHTSAVAFGVAIIFQASAIAFTGLKLLGAAYLVYLAWQAFRASAAKIEAKRNHGLNTAKLYRRGIYNFIKLTVSPPKAIIFDGSNRDRCEVTRNRTNTPLQALVMLNDPMVLEASRVLAIRLGKETKDLDLALERAFSRIVCRTLKPKEKEFLTEYYLSELAYFRENADQAASQLTVGEFPLDPLDVTPENAAFMQVVVSLYNLEETLTKT